MLFRIKSLFFFPKKDWKLEFFQYIHARKKNTKENKERTCAEYVDKNCFYSDQTSLSGEILYAFELSLK